VPQNSPWRHHYIPEFYLKQWAGKKGQLVEYSKPWGDVVKPKRVYPRQTGFEDRLNELNGLPNNTRQHFEKYFYSPVDSAAASVLNALTAGRREFALGDRLAWARFMISLVVRNPENIKAATARLSENIRNDAAERGYQAARRPADPNTLKEYIEQADLTDEFSRSAKQVVASIVENGLVVNHISHMQWGALTLPFDAPQILTSDRPLFMTCGLMDPSCQVLMPLGPKVVFYAVNHIDIARSFGALLPDEIAATVNNNVVRRAEL
jgi:hypothetical protein